MEILRIFDDKLFAFRYDNEEYENEDDTEFGRLVDLWTDVNYLKEFFEKNKVSDREFFRKNKFDTVELFVDAVRNEAEKIADTLAEISDGNRPIESYFQSFDDNEIRVKTLSRQKGKVFPKILRMYAIRIDVNCYVITGGAIKLAKTADGHLETKEEKLKLDRAKTFLQSNGIFDEDSFYDYLLTNTTL